MGVQAREEGVWKVKSLVQQEEAPSLVSDAPLSYQCRLAITSFLSFRDLHRAQGHVTKLSWTELSLSPRSSQAYAYTTTNIELPY